MNAEAFNAALRLTFSDVRVEAEGRVAILTFPEALPVDSTSRRRIVAMAREHGFSNVALELTPDANLPGDQPAR